MLGAVLWVIYGVASRARPVVAANLLVLTAAAVATWRHRGITEGTGGSGLEAGD
jgi:hypothetical protein